MITIHGTDADYIYNNNEDIKIDSNNVQLYVTLTEMTNLLEVLAHTYHSCSEISIKQGNYLFKKESSDKISMTYTVDELKSINLNYQNFIHCLEIIYDLSQLDDIKNKVLIIEVTNHQPH